MVLLGNINLRQADSSAEAAEYSSGSLLCSCFSGAQTVGSRAIPSLFWCGIFLRFILTFYLFSRVGEFYLFLLLLWLVCLPFCFWFFELFLCTFDQAAGSSAAITDGKEAHWSNSAVSVFMAIFIFIFTFLLSFFYWPTTTLVHILFQKKTWAAILVFTWLFSIDHFFFFLRCFLLCTLDQNILCFVFSTCFSAFLLLLLRIWVCGFVYHCFDQFAFVSLWLIINRLFVPERERERGEYSAFKLLLTHFFRLSSLLSSISGWQTKSHFGDLTSIAATPRRRWAEKNFATSVTTATATTANKQTTAKKQANNNNSKNRQFDKANMAANDFRSHCFFFTCQRQLLPAPRTLAPPQPAAEKTFNSHHHHHHHHHHRSLQIDSTRRRRRTFAATTQPRLAGLLLLLLLFLTASGKSSLIIFYFHYSVLSYLLCSLGTLKHSVH